KRHDVKPWVVFSEPSLQDMATYYPISLPDMNEIQGVSVGKAQKYGKPFVALIKEYVEENDIDRAMEHTVKQVANKSRNKVAIIQSIDRKIPLDYIAEQVGMSMEDLLNELNMIVDAGTKLNIDYYLNDNMDEDVVEEIFDYFNDDAEDDSVESAIRELQEEDITMEEVQLVRIKFMTEVAN
ncbi:HRDC domain-containing protein, partial [bacterium]|nr:HRDC domain-containing protein [bacterium]